MNNRLFTLEDRITYILEENFLLRQRVSKLEMYLYFILFYNFVFYFIFIFCLFLIIFLVHTLQAKCVSWLNAFSLGQTRLGCKKTPNAFGLGQMRLQL